MSYKNRWKVTKAVDRRTFVAFVSLLAFIGSVFLFRDEYERQWLTITVADRRTEVLLVTRRNVVPHGTVLLFGASREWPRMGRDARVIADSGYQVVAILGAGKVCSSAAKILKLVASSSALQLDYGNGYLLILNGGYDLDDLGLLTPLGDVFQPHACVLIGNINFWTDIYGRNLASFVDRLSYPIIIIEPRRTLGDSDKSREFMFCSVDHYGKVKVVDIEGVGSDLGTARGVAIRAVCEALRARNIVSSQ